MARLVQCVKLGRELPGLEKPPFPGYELWQPHMTILINHYGLNPADPETRRILRREMEEFFFGEDARLPEGWVAPGAAPSKGGGGGAARKK